jgi:hypothetical protein
MTCFQEPCSRACNQTKTEYDGLERTLAKRKKEKKKKKKKEDTHKNQGESNYRVFQ